MRRWFRYWPWVAGILFWVGGVSQVVEILTSQTAAGVSLIQWALCSFVLYVYAAYYAVFVEDGAKLHPIIVSTVSGTLYAIITALVLIY